jgi:hypothetical protein
MLWAVDVLSHQPHLKSKAQSRDSDSVSDEEDQEDAQAHEVQGPMYVGSPPGVKRLLLLQSVPYRPCRQLVVREVLPCV